MTAQVFKSRDRHMSFPTRGAGLIVFSNYRCITKDQKIIDAIKNELLDDPAAGVYIDENEKELPDVLTAEQVRNEEVQAFLAQKQQQQLPESETDNKAPLSAQSAADAAGKNNPAANRFTAVETASASALRAQLLNNKS